MARLPRMGAKGASRVLVLCTCQISRLDIGTASPENGILHEGTKRMWFVPLLDVTN